MICCHESTILPTWICGSNDTGELTSAQRVFAVSNGAVARLCATFDDRLIFMYREERDRALRWLVDEGGLVVDLKVFHRSRCGA